ncbi:MAG: zinc ABC transporter substrate-binding protein [Pirellulaceae bacterium]|nr:zinc ABC transporter substrate-binding protein [Pirellulaceae bacterium]
MLHFRFLADFLGFKQAFLAIALLGVAVIGGCGQSAMSKRQAPTANFSGTPPIRVIATVGMVADMVQAVGGEHVRVEQMMSAGVDPHLYKPTRDDVRLVMKADVVVSSGLHLEGKLSETLEKLARTKPVYSIADGLPPELLIRDGDSQEAVDPHIWMDISLWGQGASALAEWLADFDPTHAGDYRRNATEYVDQLEQLHRFATETIHTIPESQRYFVTSHDAFRYFGRAYQLEVVGVQGFSTESEAGLRRVNAIVNLLVERQIRSVFFESSVASRSLQAIVEGASARGRQIEIAGPLYSDAMGEAGTYEGTYIGMMDHNITTVARALGASPPPQNFHDYLDAAKQKLAQINERQP